MKEPVHWRMKLFFESLTIKLRHRHSSRERQSHPRTREWATGWQDRCHSRGKRYLSMKGSQVCDGGAEKSRALACVHNPLTRARVGGGSGSALPAISRSAGEVDSSH